MQILDFKPHSNESVQIRGRRELSGSRAILWLGTEARRPATFTAGPLAASSASADDVGATKRTLVGTISGISGSPATARSLVGTIVGSESSPGVGDKLRLTRDDQTYDYTLVGTETGSEDILDGLTAVVAASNSGDGDALFTVSNTPTEVDLVAKTTGTGANTSTVGLSWVFVTTGTATADLVNTPGEAEVPSTLPVPGDKLRLGVDAANYDYVVTGDEAGPGDLYAGLSAVVAASNDGDGDPVFETIGVSDEFDMRAKVAGTTADESEVTLSWVIGAADADLVNTPSGIGSGTQALDIEYLDENGKHCYGVLQLDGTTQVATDFQVTSVLDVAVRVGDVPHGKITIRSVADEIEVENLPTGESRAMPGLFVVPNKKRLWLTAFQAASADDTNHGLVRVVSNRSPVTMQRVGALIPWTELQVFRQQEDTEAEGWLLGPFEAGDVVALDGVAGSWVTATAFGFMEDDV